MKNILINTLSQGGFIVLNKALIKVLGSLDLACILSFFIDKSGYFNGNDFYYTIENIQQDTTLTDKNIRSCIKKLVELGILIKREFKGLPPKQYYNINFNKLAELLNSYENPTKSEKNGSDNTNQKETFNPCKNGNLNPTKNGSDNIKNNKNPISKTKENKTKENKTKENKTKNLKEKKIKKEKSKKEILREKAIFIFESKKEVLKISLSEWLEWVDYKLSKEKDLTEATFLKNINQLEKFGLNAKQSIETSISSGWRGLFEIKSKKREIDYNQCYTDNAQQCEFIDELLEKGYYPSKEERNKNKSN